jgi:YggT family protein
MFIVGNFLSALAQVIHIILNLLMWLIVVRAVLSWVSPDPYNPIVRFIHNVTEPMLYQVRKRLPLQYGGIDLSPIIVILAIVFSEQFIVSSLQVLALRLR